MRSSICLYVVALWITFRGKILSHKTVDIFICVW